MGLIILKILIKSGGDFNCRDVYNLTPLHHAGGIILINVCEVILHPGKCSAMRGNIKIIEHLVKEPGVKLDSRDKMGSTALHIAGSALTN